MTLGTNRCAAVILTLWTMSACHSLPPRQQPETAPGSNPAPSEATQSAVTGNAAPPSVDDVPTMAPAQVPACLPAADMRAKPARKPKPKALVHVQRPPLAPVAAAPPKLIADAGVKTVTVPESSVLGRRVRGPQGDDLGRVVDVLADAQGRVRIAIIEFGGFLGVGNRRIAVDWSLLKFHPHDPDAPVVLDVAREQFQETPEYKGSARPVALMAPEIAASAPSNTPH
jgi:hypothetical protein